MKLYFSFLLSIFLGTIAVILFVKTSDAGLGEGKLTKKEIVPFQTQRAFNHNRVERVLNSLTLEEKIAQMIISYPQLDKEGPVRTGGVIFVGKMLQNKKKVREIVRSTLIRSRIPLFFAADIEGGTINPVSNYPVVDNLPSAREMSYLPDKVVEEWGFQVGLTMSSIGLNVNLAPVLDVAEVGHMYQNRRSFSGDPKTVLKSGRAYARGLLKAQILPVGKHFPGYGNARQDTDHKLVKVEWGVPEIEKMMGVFNGAKGWLGGVMLSNLIYTSYSNYPAILTKKLVKEAKKHGLLTITDDLAVKILAKSVGGSREEVVRRAFLAGNDLLLTTAPPDWKKGVDYVGVIYQLVENSPQLKQQLNASCYRILSMKDRMGMLKNL